MSGKTYAYEKGSVSITKLTWDDAIHPLKREGVIQMGATTPGRPERSSPPSTRR